MDTIWENKSSLLNKPLSLSINHPIIMNFMRRNNKDFI